jgi:hypothetical protein
MAQRTLVKCCGKQRGGPANNDGGASNQMRTDGLAPGAATISVEAVWRSHKVAGTRGVFGRSVRARDE